MTRKYKPQVIKDYIVTILDKLNVKTKDAQIVANILVEADMRGIYSHGINGLDTLIIPAIKENGINLNAKIIDKARNKNFPIRHLDSQGSLGHVAAMKAVVLVKKLASKYGLAKVYVNNANHFGAAAIYSELIAKERNLSGRVYCTTPSIVKPYGGTQVRLGTNPISWSIPYSNGVITIDMATTTHAVSRIVKSIIEKVDFPFPVYDRDNKETTNYQSFSNVQDFVNNGSMIPLGGLGREKAPKADAGYKGSGLAILIELDSVISAGNTVSINPLCHDKKRRIQHVFEAWRIDSMYSKNKVLEYISNTVINIRKCGPKTMLMPGEKEQQARQNALSNGIKYSDMQIARLKKIGKEFHVDTIMI